MSDDSALDLRRAEHFANRFGFGACIDDLRSLVGRQPGEVFDEWLERSEAPPSLDLHLVRWEDYGSDQDGTKIESPDLDPLDRGAAKLRRMELRLIDKGQYHDYLDDWIEGMVRHRDPLRDRMALFWHGFFPTNVRVVRRRYECVHQHTALRQRALGSFTDLLGSVVRDPAMLGYFDNDTSSKEHPNENFARELLELYSLGEGSYSEFDVREVARALTGFQGESGHFVFDEELHDFGEKRILGRVGNFSGEDLPAILVEQEACALYVCRKLLISFEGVEPEASRLAEYAAALREAKYEFVPVLRKLCTDPLFYREQIMGQRVQGPMEWLLGCARRLGVRPHGQFLYFAAAALGQQVYAPPTVKGWDEGEAWISHSSLLLRGKCVGLMLGRGAAIDAEQQEASGPNIEQAELMREVHSQAVEDPDLLSRAVLGVGLKAGDAAIASWAAHEWLACRGPGRTRAWLLTQLEERRAEAQIEGPMLQHAVAEGILRRLAHALLSLPVAQLG